MRTSLHGLLALLLVASAAQAGVVVLKNGKVIVGNIPADTDTSEKLVVRWPTKTKDDRGEAEFLKADIRWYSRDHDAPTDAYFEQFEDEPLADEFLGLREKWRARRAQEEELKTLSPTGDPSKESAEVALTPEEKKAEPAPVASATPEPAPAAPAAAPAPGSSGLCSLGGRADPAGSLLPLALVAAVLLLLRRGR